MNFIAEAFARDVHRLSFRFVYKLKYRESLPSIRLQRFFKQFTLDYELIAQRIFNLFFSVDKSVYITINRTN